MRVSGLPDVAVVNGEFSWDVSNALNASDISNVLPPAMQSLHKFASISSTSEPTGHVLKLQ